MKYCPDCGSAVAKKWDENDGRERDVCTSCGATHYTNPQVIVSCMVCWGEKILLCRRANEPGRGKWLAPCGYLECGESLEEGAVRETFEETGVRLDPENLELYTVVNMTAINQIAVVFRTQLSEKPLIHPGPECLDAEFLGKRDIPPDQIAWHHSFGDGPLRFFEELRCGEFSIQLTTLASVDGTGFKSRRYHIQRTRQPG